ncbi:hypothetical protein [Brevibacterium paucivorans]|uniref:hypothetical protein n=1 Tax=Brevibacterium paucivorans TaxID=170994 RepID=UPI0025CB7B1C|nr:hypothetical protein [uncultured Brevibacterium sp.]
MLEALQNFTLSLPEWARWTGVILISAIPFIESYLGSAIGIMAGVNPVVAIISAIIGNTASMLLLVFGAHKLRKRVSKNDESSMGPKKAKLKKLFDKWGVPGVSLLGQTVLPSQITSMTMVSFGASRNAVAGWQCASIVLWGVLCGSLATAGIMAFG